MGLVRGGWKRAATVLVVLGAMLVAAVVHVGGAGAAVVNMKESGNQGVVEFEAAAGEANNLTVTSCGPGCVDLVDGGANISGGWGFGQAYGCFTPEASGLNGLFPARCIHPITITVVATVLGDMNDRIALSLPSSTTTFVGGGAGNDRLIGGPSIDNLYGTTDDDSISGGGNCDNIEGGSGMDTLDGGGGPDLIWGDSGIDTVDYSSRSTHVFVAPDMTYSGSANCTGAPFGNDGEFGEGDNVDPSVENVRGGSGDDSLYGSPAANLLSGGGGNDLLDGGAGADVLSGGFGFDTADYSSRAAPVNVTLDDMDNDGTPQSSSATAEADNVLSDIERVNGGAGNDSLTGDQSGNELHGNDGNDTINGNGGSDSLFGEGGNDTLDAHDMTVDDTMDCGSGSDSSYGDAMFLRPRSPAVYDSATGCENAIWIFPLQITR